MTENYQLSQQIIKDGNRKKKKGTDVTNHSHLIKIISQSRKH